jgi:uncharacterized phage infection (PIP) family protein YhgE
MPNRTVIDPRSTASAAQGLADVNETLRGLDINGQGALADRVREALAVNRRHAELLAGAADAVHRATLKYESNAEEFENNNPTDEEIMSAQQAVIDAADRAANGTGTEEDVQKAVDHLSQLLAAREHAKKKREDDDGRVQDGLDEDTDDFNNPETNPGLADMMNRGQPPMGQAPMGQPPMGGAPMGQSAPAGASPSASAPFSGANDLLDPTGSNSELPSYDPDTDFSPGRTELSGSEAPVTQQSPTLTNTGTTADISGRSGTPVTVTPSTVEGGRGGSAGMSGMPRGGMPMGGMGGGAGRGGTKDKPKIYTDDEYLTGKDMDEKSTEGGVL